MNDKIADLSHDHRFDAGSLAAERSTRLVMWITAVTMVIEIAAGWWYNSMALLADGWHMSSHAVAIGLSALAYATARRYAADPRFAFGTWKVEVLGGFASAIFLIGVAAMMVSSSLERLVTPKPIHYQEAVVIAVLGLIVNIVCALILGKAHDHGHDHGHDHHHGHDHSHDHQHHDLNLKSAYVHVISDAATSVLAIAALLGGWYYGWAWLDPVIGCLGAVLVAVWAKGLIVETGKVLLDREMDHPVVDEIREVIEAPSERGSSRLTDLHVWRVGKRVYSCALTLVTTDPALSADEVRQRLAVHEEIVHSTIEIHHAPPP
ncbi:MAG TPA: CDF family Co(II)/Ni(II) efflux transporter DmeF [Candidatus Acidoferrum sp.]|nr:CDF family Co(II)/Ni(II) efflux transporter DmeF [Candidatus Acidoferrum sp.]